MNIGEGVVLIIIIISVGVILFVLPLKTIADRTDDLSTIIAETETTKTVDKVLSTGVFTLDDYSKYEYNITTETRNSYSIEIEARIMDENPGKKTTQANANKQGENESYSLYTEQILDILNNKKALTLKEGDMFFIITKNTNIPFSQIFALGSNLTNTIVAQHGGYVVKTGSAE